MGKQITELIYDRILSAEQRAADDGYKPEDVRWYVTQESLTEFQCLWAYSSLDHAPWNDYPIELKGRVDGHWVELDHNLKGQIAELRATNGTQYAITLDFSDDDTN